MPVIAALLEQQSEDQSYESTVPSPLRSQAFRIHRTQREHIQRRQVYSVSVK